MINMAPSVNVTVNVNYLAILVASVASFLLGWLWHSPMVFGKMWMKLSDMDQKKIDAAKKKGMAKPILLQFIATLVMGYVLAYFVSYAEAGTIIEGAMVGIWTWIGFVATVMIGMVIWEGKPFKLFLINAGHVLVSLIVMGAILAVWP